MGWEGHGQVNITVIIRPKGAKVAQNPNVSEGLSVTYSDSRQSESGVSVSEVGVGTPIPVENLVFGQGGLPTTRVLGGERL